MKFDASAMAAELIPVAIQTLGIAVFLIMTQEDSFQAFTATILSLMWLKVSKNKMAEDFGDFRLRRHLFSLIGEWMNRDEAAEEFDAALERYQMIDGSIEDDEYRAVVTAAGFANGIRSIVSFSATIYLGYLILVAVGSGQLT